MRRRRVAQRRSVGVPTVSAPLLKGGSGAVRLAQRAEAGSDSCHSFASSFEHCESHIARSHRVNVTLHENLLCSSSGCRTACITHNSPACDTGVHDAMQRVIRLGRNSGNSSNSRGDTEAGGKRFCVPGGDDEPLFGKCGDAKLIVSLSLGSSVVFRWRRQSCLDDEGHLCCLGHGDILVMDGQCQDEFLHRTDPGREQERINITFRWVKQHISSCPMFKAGVACCLPTCGQGSSVPVMGNAVLGVFWAFGLLFGVLCIWGILVFLGSLLCTRLGLHRCASCWTRPLGGGRWGHYLCNLWEEYLTTHKTAYQYFGMEKLQAKTT